MRPYSSSMMKVNLQMLLGANTSGSVSSVMISNQGSVFSDNRLEAVNQSGDQQQSSESELSQSSEGEGEEEEEEAEEEEEQTCKEGQDVEEETPEEEEVKVEWPTGVPQASDKDLAKLSVKEGVSSYR